MEDTSERYGTLVEEMRGFLDTFSRAKLSDEEIARMRAEIGEMRARLEPLRVDESQGPFRKMNADGTQRVQCASPPLRHIRIEGGEYLGSVRIGDYFAGWGGAAHGGMVAVVFDEALGRLSASGEAPRSVRTAYLNVNYRNLTPLGVDLEVRGRIDRVEGRKYFISGEIRSGDLLCADAQALFIEVQPQ